VPGDTTADLPAARGSSGSRHSFFAGADSRSAASWRFYRRCAEVEGLSCAEIAAALGIPIGTVWTRLHAARRELRRALDEGEKS